MTIANIPADEKEVPKKPNAGGEPSENKKILNHLDYFAEYLKGQEKDGAIETEWKAVALVIDRLFFWMTLIVALIIVPTCLSLRAT